VNYVCTFRNAFKVESVDIVHLDIGAEEDSSNISPLSAGKFVGQVGI
jgi:hypothetical protein